MYLADAFILCTITLHLIYKYISEYVGNSTIMLIHVMYLYAHNLFAFQHKYYRIPRLL